MATKFFCPYWGLESMSLADAAKKVKTAGYDGMEVGAAASRAAEAARAMRDNGLDLILMAFGNSANFTDHKKQYRADLEALAAQKPRFINAHTGHDYFTFEQNAELIRTATEVSVATGVTILHETHRGRFTYSLPAIQHYLVTFPDMKLTGDFSHWVNVSESYLEPQTDNMTRAINQTEHIHARIGHPEGPQVNDPRAPEWANALEIHAKWWDQIRNRPALAGRDLTVTCEFGPAPGYLPTLPYTQMPVVSQWDVNLFMKEFLSKRWR